jgi:predicted nicotinamide N-methyase
MRGFAQLIVLHLLLPVRSALLPPTLSRRVVDVQLATGISISVVEVADWEWWEKQSNDDSSNPHGAKLWPAAVACARFITARPQLLEGKSVLELGCGNGLCSLAAARAGASSVLATDLSTDALGLTREACELNALPALQTMPFDVGSREPLPAADVVVCADMLYDETLAKLVARRVVEASKKGAWVIVGTDLQRGPRYVFLDTLRELRPDSPSSFEESHSVALKAVGCASPEARTSQIDLCHSPLPLGGIQFPYIPVLDSLRPRAGKEKNVGLLQLNAPDDGDGHSI